MKSVTFSTTVDAEVDVDICEVWYELDEQSRKEFMDEVGLISKRSEQNQSEWKDFVYDLEDDDVKEILHWIEFYKKGK